MQEKKRRQSPPPSTIPGLKLQEVWEAVGNTLSNRSSSAGSDDQPGKLLVGPFRSLDDFLLKGTFTLPQFPLSRILNRVRNNLHYYEANYAVIGLVLLILMLVMQPQIILTISMYGAIAGFLQYWKKSPSSPPAVRQHADAGSIAVGFLVFLSSGLWFLLAAHLVLWSLIVLAHAGSRTRSLGNKFVNVQQATGTRQSVASDVIEAIFSFLPAHSD